MSNSHPATVQACIQQGAELFTQADLFYGHGTDNAEDEALWLVFYGLDIAWDSDESVLQQSLSEEDWQRIYRLFKARVERRVPAAYLTGEAWFAGYPFTVNESVLVPRSPIAELILQAYQPWLTIASPKILDLCTGSGCIGIASALYMPDAEVVLSDISPEAIRVAQDNIQRYSLDKRVSALISDGLDAFLVGHERPYFDLIVSNPPYVDAEDFASMPAEYHAEPALGLVSGDDGLDFTRRLLAQAAQCLSDQGIIIVEVGNSWEALQRAYPQLPFTWLEFERGGHGVFMLTREQLTNALDN